MDLNSGSSLSWAMRCCRAGLLMKDCISAICCCTSGLQVGYEVLCDRVLIEGGEIEGFQALLQGRWSDIQWVCMLTCGSAWHGQWVGHDTEAAMFEVMLEILGKECSLIMQATLWF